MFRLLTNLAKTETLLPMFFRKTPPRHLGRWGLADDKTELRALQACIDSCGDTLCGNPEIYQKEKKRTYPNVSKPIQSGKDVS